MRVTREIWRKTSETLYFLEQRHPGAVHMYCYFPKREIGRKSNTIQLYPLKAKYVHSHTHAHKIFTH